MHLEQADVIDIRPDHVTDFANSVASHLINWLGPNNRGVRALVDESIRTGSYGLTPEVGFTSMSVEGQQEGRLFVFRIRNHSAISIANQRIRVLIFLLHGSTQYDDVVTQKAALHLALVRGILGDALRDYSDDLEFASRVNSALG